MHASLGKVKNFDVGVVEKGTHRSMSTNFSELRPRGSQCNKWLYAVLLGSWLGVWLVCGPLIRRSWSVYSVTCFWVTHIEQHMSIFRSSSVEQRCWRCWFFHETNEKNDDAMR